MIKASLDLKTRIIGIIALLSDRDLSNDMLYIMTRLPTLVLPNRAHACVLFLCSNS